jgi:sugar transferase (PEP-CTERM/EpsH1 system associated)
MRVLFLTQRVPFAPNRGDRIRAFHMLQAMSTFASVSVFCFAHDAGEEAAARTVPFADHVVAVPVPRVRNLVRGVFQLATRKPLTHVLLDAPGARAALEALIGRAKPDVVLAFCSSMSRFLFEPPLNRFGRVIDFVDVDSAKWREMAAQTRRPMRWIYEREARTLGRFEASSAAAVQAALVCSDRERDTLELMAPGAPIHVIENGVDLAAFHPREPPAVSATVVFCGVMNYEPNRQGILWFAREIWPHIRAARPDARLVVVGSDPTPDVLALSGHEAIEVVGRVPAVQPYLWASAVSIAPLLLARGIQNKVLEALAAGLPVVTTPNVWEGLPAEARDGCISAAEPAEFAAAVVRLLALPADLRRSIPLACRLDVLTWAHRLSELHGILETARRSSAS